MNEKNLTKFRKYHYWRGFVVGAVLTLMVCGGAFIAFCHALLAVVE